MGEKPLTCTILLVLLCIGRLSADHEYMVTAPDPVVIPDGFASQLTCEMNIQPDKFLWKYYPVSNPEDAYNPKKIVDLSNATFEHLGSGEIENGKSSLNLVQENGKLIAGDYQCLAYYGASVVASVPWKITIATLGDFVEGKVTKIETTVGNTILWRCEPPFSNPEAYIDYLKGSSYIQPTLLLPKVKSLILENIDLQDSGIYKCRATSAVGGASKDSKEYLDLRVMKYGRPQAPFFVSPPETLYNATRGSTVFLECAASGNPVPQVTWFKKTGELDKSRTEVLKGGLKISNITAKDEGVYICSHKNEHGHISKHITFVFIEEPSIECPYNATKIKQSERLEIECIVKGIPEPNIAWFLNGYSVKNDTAIEGIQNKLYITSVEKRHAGYLQIFASNSLKTVYSGISIKVIPLSSSGEVPGTTQNHYHRKKPGGRKPAKHIKTKIIPPDKPTVTRLNDHAVVVRWSVQRNTGLPIQFFKVQYRELGYYSNNEFIRSKNTRWKTCNDDIAYHLRNYEVDGLKPEHLYRFRIAAVYSNNDNKLSNNSDKFLLRGTDFYERNPLPVPLITHTEPVNTSAVKIYWECPKSANMSVEGFFINYILASRAGDFSKVSIDDNTTNYYVLSHLEPDALYDIKLQSFTSKSASEFSKTMKVKTLAPPVESTTIHVSTNQNANGSESKGSSRLYVFIAVGVIGVALILTSIAILLGCRKWKQRKNTERDKPTVEEHHIQADGNDFVVRTKTLPRSNGYALAPNRITITANPLADTDKSQNMIEMTCLTSQNNNCASSAATQPSGTSEESNCNASEKRKNNEKRNKFPEIHPHGENYV